MDTAELIAKYFERYIFVIENELRRTVAEEKIKCTLVGLIASDLLPQRTTALLGFCTLFLKAQPNDKYKLILPSEEFRSYNEKTLEFCYQELSTLIDKSDKIDMVVSDHRTVNKNSKAILLINLREFETKYRSEANKYHAWFDKTMKIRSTYKKLLTQHEDEVEYLERILEDIRNGKVLYPIITETIRLSANNEIIVKKNYLDQKATSENRIVREINSHKTEIAACEHQYNHYTKIINDSMVEERVKEKLSYLASYAIDYLERGCESIDFNNNRNFAYHSYLEMPAEGVLGNKNFAFEDVRFSENEVQNFLVEYFDYNVDQNKTNSKQFSKVPKRPVEKNKKQINLLIKKTFETISKQKKNKNKTKNEILYLAANKLAISYETAKWGLYYKSKKLVK